MPNFYSLRAASSGSREPLGGAGFPCSPVAHMWRYTRRQTDLITVFGVSKFGPYKGSELALNISAWYFKVAAIVCMALWNITAKRLSAKCFSKALSVFKGILVWLLFIEEAPVIHILGIGQWGQKWYLLHCLQGAWGITCLTWFLQALITCRYFCSAFLVGHVEEHRWSLKAGFRAMSNWLYQIRKVPR